TDESVSVMEGDSVTLHNDVNKTQDGIINWYFNSTHITGSLTLTNITITDSGRYFLQIVNVNDKIFSVSVR
ncbi:hypothetical protein M9458_045410, partial [Cirrhinus mrigala]